MRPARRSLPTRWRGFWKPVSAHILRDVPAVTLVLALIIFGSGVAAGGVGALLGIGGGVLKVPALNAWCGIPVRAAAATSAFMIGVTATGGAIIYYGRGDLPVLAAAPAILGVQLGSWFGLRLTDRVPAKWLKVLLVVVLLTVTVLMFTRSLR